MSAVESTKKIQKKKEKGEAFVFFTPKGRARGHDGFGLEANASTPTHRKRQTPAIGRRCVQRRGRRMRRCGVFSEESSVNGRTKSPIDGV